MSTLTYTDQIIKENCIYQVTYEVDYKTGATKEIGRILLSVIKKEGDY